MRLGFLPYNYTQTMYQQLQNLSQGSKTVDKYTEEFYKYLTWVDLGETDDQLVSRYIGGLRQNIQDSLNLFDPDNVSAAHQRALLLEKTTARGSTGFFGHGTGGNTTRYNGPFTLEAPPNQQSLTGLQLQSVHLTGVQLRMGLNALSVVN
jgi:hypothetical protein